MESIRGSARILKQPKEVRMRDIERIDRTNKIVINLMKENDRLKDKINENNICYDELLKLKEFFYNKSKTLYYCLDEIEKIILKRQEEHYCYCDECSPFKEILQKIKEVKENE